MVRFSKWRALAWSSLGVGLLPCGRAVCQEPITALPPAQCKPEKGPKTIFSWSECKPSNGEEKKENGNGEEPEEPDRIATDRPDATEASTTVGRGRIQLEMGYTFSSDKANGSRTKSHSFPEALLRVGVLADWLELRLGWNYGSAELSELGLSSRGSGAEDLYIGTKLALTEQKEFLPEMAIILQATLPTGADAFTANRTLPGVNLLYGWDVNDFLSCAGSTAANAARDSLGHDYTELFQSFTVGYSLADRLGAYTEWFAFFPHGATDPGTLPQHYFNGGFTYLITDNFQLDVRAGVGLNKAADDYFLGTGLSVRF